MNSNSSRNNNFQEVFVPYGTAFQLASDDVLADLCYNHHKKLLVSVKTRGANGFVAVVVNK